MQVPHFSHTGLTYTIGPGPSGGKTATWFAWLMVSCLAYLIMCSSVDRAGPGRTRARPAPAAPQSRKSQVMSIAVAPFVRTERFKLYCGQEKYLIRNNRTVRASIAMIKSTLIAALLVFWGVESFTAPATARRSSVLASTVEAESPTVGEPIQPPLERDRYVATNRFEVRSGRAAKFEKRW